MNAKEITELLEKIKNVKFNDYLEDDNGQLGSNPYIVIQLIDDDFEYGYWDYFYKTPIDNCKWFKEFEKQFKKYLKEYDSEDEYDGLNEINVYVAYFDDDNIKPYGYWNVLEDFYEKI